MQQAEQRHYEYALELLEYAKYAVKCCHAFGQNVVYHGAVRPVYAKHLSFRYPGYDWNAYLEKVDKNFAAGTGKFYEQCVHAGKKTGPLISHILLAAVTHKPGAPMLRAQHRVLNR